jgi:ribosome maturation factor RimP
MEAITTKLKVRYYIGKSIKLTYNSKISQTNEIHGVINAVTKDNVCLIDFDKREHIIKKTNIIAIIEVKRKTKQPMKK